MKKLDRIESLLQKANELADQVAEPHQDRVTTFDTLKIVHFLKEVIAALSHRIHDLEVEVRTHRPLPCSRCKHQLVEDKDIIKMPQGQIICTLCHDQLFAPCACCEDIHEKDHMRVVVDRMSQGANRSGLYVCVDCDRQED